MSGKMIIVWPICAFSILSGMTVSPAAGAPEAICSWAGKPVIIDGNLDEWKNMPTTFFEEDRLILGISNDSGFLYLFLRTDDADLIRAIRMSGLKIWLDHKGKKKKDLQFHYRGGPNVEELAAAGLADTSRFSDRGEDGQSPMSRPKDMADIITLTDKNLDFEQVIPADGSMGPVVRYTLDRGFCVFELAFPLQDHLVDYYGFKAAAGQKIGIGAQWGGRPDRGMRGGGPLGGMGGMPPGGVGGDQGARGGRPGARGRQIPRLEEREIWIKTTLATPIMDQK